MMYFNFIQRFFIFLLFIQLSSEGIALAQEPSITKKQPAAKDIRLTFDGALFDQDSKRVILRLLFESPLYEWVNPEGIPQLEIGIGKGNVTVFREPNKIDKIPISARIMRYKGGPRVSNDSQKIWSLRGDIYLKSKEYPLIEMEWGVDAVIPKIGTIKEFKRVPLPENGDKGFSRVVERMSDFQNAGLGGAFLATGFPVLIFGLPRNNLAYMGYIQITKIKVTESKRSASERDADRILSRLQYIQADYPLAVKNGKIINEGEYGEQILFIQEIKRMAETLKIPHEIRQELSVVHEYLDYKKTPTEVSELIEGITQKLIRLLWLKVAAPEPGKLEDAKRTYKIACASCHGIDGKANTPTAKTLDPAPADFHDKEFIEMFSPYRAYNAITWGIAGTGMAPFFDVIPNSTRWALAFYPFQLFYKKAQRDEGEKIVRQYNIRVPSLEDLSLWTNKKMRKYIQKQRSVQFSDEEIENILAYLRTKGTKVSGQATLLKYRRILREAAKSAQKEKTTSLKSCEDTAKALNKKLGSSNNDTLRSVEALCTAIREKSPEISQAAYLALSKLQSLEQSPFSENRISEEKKKQSKNNSNYLLWFFIVIGFALFVFITRRIRRPSQ